MRNTFFNLILIVLATGVIAAGGNMENKFPMLVLFALCVLGLVLLNSRTKARN